VGTHSWAETVLFALAMVMVAASGLGWLVAAARLALGRGWLPRPWRNALARAMAAAGLNAGLPLVAPRPRRPVPWAFFDLVALVGFWLIVSAVVGGVFRRAGWLPAETHLDRWEMLPARVALAYNVAVPLVTMAISLPIIALRTGATLRDLGVEPRELAADVRLGLIALVMLAPPVYGVQALLVTWWKPSEHPLIVLVRQAPHWDVFLWLCLSAGVVAPLVEELLFRVLLQGFLEKAVAWRGPVHELVFGASPPPADERPATSKCEAPPRGSASMDALAGPIAVPHEDAAGVTAIPPEERMVPAACVASAECSSGEFPPSGGQGWLPAGLSAILFGLMHYSHGPDWIPLIGFGLGLGYLYRQTHRLGPCCVVHAAFNGLSLWGLWVEVFS
jgi:membrane protease YdiL (CAAX protease family)